MPASYNGSQVMKWLATHSVHPAKISPTLVGDLIKACLTVAQAESMFATTLNSYTRTFGAIQHFVLRASKYTVPKEIAAAITVVGDLMNFPAEPRTPIRVTDDGAANNSASDTADWPNDCTGSPAAQACAQKVQPSVLRARYKYSVLISSLALASRVSLGTPCSAVLGTPCSFILDTPCRLS